MKRSKAGFGEIIGDENKNDGLVMNMLLLPSRKGSIAGENSPAGDIGGRVAGSGVNIPGIRLISASVPSRISIILSALALFVVVLKSLSDGLAFSKEANLAAGETSPVPRPPLEVSAARGEGPVRR